MTEMPELGFVVDEPFVAFGAERGVFRPNSRRTSQGFFPLGLEVVGRGNHEDFVRW